MLLVCLWLFTVSILWVIEFHIFHKVICFFSFKIIFLTCFFLQTSLTNPCHRSSSILSYLSRLGLIKNITYLSLATDLKLLRKIFYKSHYLFILNRRYYGQLYACFGVHQAWVLSPRYPSPRECTNMMVYCKWVVDLISRSCI